MQYGVVALLGLLTLGPGIQADTTPRRIGEPASANALDNSERMSDAEIRRRIIAESIDGYPGPCACPYQLARNGSRCGGRSAYSRGGGYAPLCYANDVSDEMVRRYRAEHDLN